MATTTRVSGPGNRTPRAGPTSAHRRLLIQPQVAPGSGLAPARTPLAALVPVSGDRAVGSPRARRERGAVAAELVVATPLMLFLLLAVVQFGVWLHAVHIAQAGADQALAAARAQGGSVAVGRAQADMMLTQLAGGILTGPAVDVTAVTGPGGQPQIRVQVSGSAASVVPLLHLPVHVVAQGPQERWTTPNGTTP